jgi:hypothetical protein
MIKKSIFVLALFMLCMILSGCGSAVPTESTFKKEFSLNAIVEANKQYLLDEARVLSGTEVGENDRFTQRHEELSARIDPADRPAFMDAVRSDIEQALIDSDAHIVGSETSSAGHFSFRYNENGLHGTIHVWGVPGMEADYTVIVLITEG